MKKNIIFFINVFFPILIALGLLELLLMSFPPSKITKKWNYRTEDTSRLTTEIYGLKFAGHLNSLGLRGEEPPLEHNGFRVLALGDSITYGYGLDNKDSWPKQAERYLHARGFNDIEVLNGGIPGLDTSEEYDFFANHTYKLKPDVVMVGFYINDCGKFPSDCEAAELQAELDGFWNKAKKGSGLYTLNYIRFICLKYRLRKAIIRQHLTYYDQELPSFKRCMKAFIDFKELSQKQDFKLIVIIYPKLMQLGKNYPFNRVHRKMEQFFKQQGIEAYDLTSEFYGHKDTDLWISDDNPHPNKKANKIAANKISEIILKYYQNPAPRRF